jgi:hypothetical protein
MLDDRQALVFGGAWINRAFEHDKGTAFHMLADGFRSGNQWAIVWPIVAADGRWNTDDDDIRIGQMFWIGCEIGVDVFQFPGMNLTGEIQSLAKFGDFLPVDVETYGAGIPGKTERERQAHVAKAHDCDARRLRIRKCNGPVRYKTQKGWFVTMADSIMDNCGVVQMTSPQKILGGHQTAFVM